MKELSALRLLDGLTIDEIREQLELSGCFSDVDLEDYDNEQIYLLALQELTDC